VVKILVHDLHIIIACPSTGEPCKSVVLAEAGRIRCMAAVTREVRIEAEERHDGLFRGGGGGCCCVRRM
jgi:hypothetical protein